MKMTEYFEVAICIGIQAFMFIYGVYLMNIQAGF